MVGTFCEGSEDIHNLIQSMAETRVASADLLRGQQEVIVREDLEVVVGQLRRRLSVAIARANSNCLLSRLSLIGEGSKEASKRRQWTYREETIMKNEREAQWHRRTRGHGIKHRGGFFNR